MQAAPIPKNEEQRLRALHDLKILDTPPEDKFDRITRLAQRIFDVPIATVTLIDRDRQWFKSSSGLQARETPRGVSFCSYAILGDDPMVVPDARRDHRFADNPLVTGEPRIVFYAGHPLRAADGSKIGTLCLMGPSERRLTPEDLRILADLANLAERELNAVELNAALSRLQESEASLRDFMDNASDLIQMVDIDSRFVYVNRAWRQSLGYADEEIERLTLMDILDPASQEAFLELGPRVLAGETLYNVRPTLRDKNGKPFIMEGSVNCRFKDGKPLYTRAILHDITERARTEKLKAEVLSIANHELRNPLSVIIVAMDTLVDGKAGELPESALSLAQMAQRSGKRMLGLINDYLNVEKLESGGAEFKREPVELLALLRQALEAHQPLAAKKEARLVLAGARPAVVSADPDRLMQVLTNLLSNAIKFTLPRTQVSVSITLTEAAARVSVKDEGPGIPEEFQARVFQKFAQASQALEGSGLGLSIARAIVERLGGTIGFESRVGEGTTFFFELPLSEAP